MLNPAEKVNWENPIELKQSLKNSIEQIVNQSWQPNPNQTYPIDGRSEEHTGEYATDYRYEQGEYPTDYRDLDSETEDKRTFEHRDDSWDPRILDDFLRRLVQRAQKWEADPNKEYAEDQRSSEHTGDFAIDYRSDEHTGNFSKDYRSTEHTNEDYDPRVFENPSYNPRIWEVLMRRGDGDYVPYVPDPRYEYADDPRDQSHQGEYAVDTREISNEDPRSGEHTDPYHDPRPEGFREGDTLPDTRDLTDLVRTAKDDPVYTPWQPDPSQVYATDRRDLSHQGAFAPDPRPPQFHDPHYDPRSDEHRHDTDRRSADHRNQGIDYRSEEHRFETDYRSDDHKQSGHDYRTDIHRYVHDSRSAEHRPGFSGVIH
jgi:hypothetical protein